MCAPEILLCGGVARPHFADFTGWFLLIRLKTLIFDKSGIIIFSEDISMVKFNCHGR